MKSFFLCTLIAIFIQGCSCSHETEKPRMVNFIKLNDDQVAFTDELQRLGFIKIDRTKHELLVTGQYWTQQKPEDRQNMVKAISGYINSEVASEQYVNVYRMGDRKPLAKYDPTTGFFAY